MVAVVVAAAASYLVAHHGIRAPSDPAPGALPGAAAQIVYTARTADTAAIILPGVVQDDLGQAGLHHQSVELTRVGSTGNVSTSYMDMTPRTGNSSTDPVLRVGGRISQAINDKVSAIETAVNSPAGSGGQALYAGLTRTNFTGAPVTIISTGLDLTNPDNFRSLHWSVPAEEVVAAMKKAGAPAGSARPGHVRPRANRRPAAPARTGPEGLPQGRLEDLTEGGRGNLRYVHRRQ